MKEPQESVCGLIVTGENTPKVFYFSEKALDQVAFYVDVFIIISGVFAVFLRGDYRCAPLIFQRLNECIAIIAFVSNDGCAINLLG